MLKEGNSARLAYMNMVSDELSYPWTGDQYNTVVAQGMAYDNFEELRISNYLILTKQTESKSPNTKPVEEKYSIIAPQVS